MNLNHQQDMKTQTLENRAKNTEMTELSSTHPRLIYEWSLKEQKEMNSSGNSNASVATELPSIVVNSSEENDDDPPPYTAIVPPNHIGWTFDFSSDIPYSAVATTPCRREPPLADFQGSPLLGGSFYPEGTDGQHTSISMLPIPRIFKLGACRSHFVHTVPFLNDSPVTKDDVGKSRRYGALLVAAAVIVFLMALSLLVHFVMERRLWRG